MVGQANIFGASISFTHHHTCRCARQGAGLPAPASQGHYSVLHHCILSAQNGQGAFPEYTDPANLPRPCPLSQNKALSTPPQGVQKAQDATWPSNPSSSSFTNPQDPHPPLYFPTHHTTLAQCIRGVFHWSATCPGTTTTLFHLTSSSAPPGLCQRPFLLSSLPRL